VTPDTTDNLYGRWNAMKLGVSADGSDDYRNVANTYGWVIEVDPFNRKSIPKKRTALGRFAHEGAWLGPAKKGEPLASYMGCDARNEYIYKYVSNRRWDPRDADQGMAAGDKGDARAAGVAAKSSDQRYQEGRRRPCTGRRR
jgi:uncharacterized protein